MNINSVNLNSMQAASQISIPSLAASIRHKMTELFERVIVNPLYPLRGFDGISYCCDS
jgi:hypothetical protein